MESWLRVEPVAQGPAWSHRVVLGDLVARGVPSAEVEGEVAAESLRGWSLRWSVGRADVLFPVGDLAFGPPDGAVPVRRFSWRPGQRHRPGLGYSVSTGRMHGFESLAERRTLLVLDFLGGVGEVSSQPFVLRFTVGGRRMEHVPDLVVLGEGGVRVVDVRPGARGDRTDAVKFAATARVAAAAGWSYELVAGWRPGPAKVIETLAARRRTLRDPLALQARLLETVAREPARLGRLVAGTGVPAVARVHLLYLLWHRRLAVDLHHPLDDATWVHLVGGAR
ncbi:TnsA-like heteromeric transposase endonuclease subunit (plasmid) [Streptomyces sp. BI20]|uniref:TnsA-like heteromeric transposase endonuclease subunit n=1 Tax=Streptomyces sp. BI20 TaxID=3403460 RepID=UPI003C76C399